MSERFVKLSSWEERKAESPCWFCPHEESRQHPRLKLVPQVASGTKGFIKSRVIHRDNWKMVGQLTWLEDCDEWKQAVSKRQAGQNWRSLTLRQGKLLVHRSQPQQLCKPCRMPWVKIREVIFKGAISVGNFYWPPNQDNKTNKIIFRSLQQALEG